MEIMFGFRLSAAGDYLMIFFYDSLTSIAQIFFTCHFFTSFFLLPFFVFVYGQSTHFSLTALSTFAKMVLFFHFVCEPAEVTTTLKKKTTTPTSTSSINNLVRAITHRSVDTILLFILKAFFVVLFRSFERAMKKRAKKTALLKHFINHRRRQ